MKGSMIFHIFNNKAFFLFLIYSLIKQFKSFLKS